MKNKRTLFHIVKREALPWYQAWMIRGAAILLALVMCSLVTVMVTGLNPLDPTPADTSCHIEKAISRCCFVQAAKLAAIGLLARRLKAASPDAAHPGKAPDFRIPGATGGGRTVYPHKLYRQEGVQGRFAPGRGLGGGEPP